MRSTRVLAHRSFRLVLAVFLVLPLLLAASFPAAAARGKGDRPGAVYTLSNAAGGNAVLVYDRAANGALTYREAVPTGGSGTGAGLGSQGALVFSADYLWLFAVNAGSNQVTVFRALQDGLVQTDLVDSGGEMPISLTVHGSLLYVLNAGGSGNITGFWISADGKLAPIPGSTQPLSNGGAGAAPGPAQVSFSPDGATLVVTEKATNLIDTFSVSNGVASAPVSHPSAGMTPFGFSFTKRGVIIVSEAFGGAPGISATSSYRVSGNMLDTITPAYSAGQTAACWVAVSKNSKYAYVANTGSSTITSFRIAKNGALTLLEAAAGFTGDGSRTADLAFSKSGQHLYALSGGTDTISAFRQQADGGLTSLGAVSVPAGAVGLAAR